MSSLSDFFDSSFETKLDPAKDNFYDADTAVVDGERYRLTGIDAPEAPTYTPNQGYMEGVFNADHTTQIEEATEKGYDTLKGTGAAGHYGRKLADLETEYGSGFAEEYTKQGLLGGSRYSVGDANIGFAHNYNRVQQLRGTQANLPDWRKSEILMQEALKPPVTGQLDTEGTFFSPLDSEVNVEGGSGSFSPIESIEYWWNTNKSAVAGLSALFDKESGKRNVEAVQQDFQENIDPNLVVSIEQIDSASDALAWAGNNFIIQGPDFGILLAGGAAAPFTGGASLYAALGYTFLKGTGSYASESIEVHGDVNTGEAVAMGAAITALDRLVPGVSNRVNPAEFFTKEGRDKIVAEIAQRNGTSVAEAAKAMDKTSLNVLRDVGKSVQIGANDLKAQKEITLGMLKRIGLRGGQEALTEAAQETIQFGGIYGMPETAEDWKRYGIRIADAAAAGGVVGAGYTLPQTLRERAEIQDFHKSFERFSPEDSNRFAAMSHKTYQEFGDVELEDAVEDYKGELTGASLEQRASRNKQNYVQRAAAKRKRQGEYAIGGSAVYNTFKGILEGADGRANKAAVLLANIEGAIQTLPGGSLYNTQSLQLGQIDVDLPWLANPEKHFNTDMTELNHILLKMQEQDYSDLTDQQVEIANKIGQDLHTMNGKLHALSGFVADDKSSRDTSFNRLLRRDIPDPALVKDDSEAFIQKLAAHKLPTPYGKKKKGEVLGEHNARALANKLMSHQDRDKLLNEFSSLQLGTEFSQFFGKSPLDMLQNHLIGEVKSATTAKYRGHNNVVISNAINELVTQGAITEDRADELAADMMDQLDKGNNLFGRDNNDVTRKGQEYLRTATTLGVMDHSLWSQAGEAAFAFFGTDKSLPESIGMVAKNWLEANNLRYKLDIQQSTDNLTEAQDQYAGLGYADFNETAQQHGAALDTKIAQKVTKYFFWVNQTAPITDAIRMARMQSAAGAIDNLVASVKDADLDNPTTFEAEQLERLRFYGGNPKKLIEIYNTFESTSVEDLADADPESPELEELFKQWDNMLPKFIDEFTVRVKPGSRPAIFEEKRFGIPLFTQFMSFTSHWSANQLPRFYSVYANAGGQMAYNAFAIAASAILAAYMAQFMKDWLKYGEESPYLKEWGAPHRALLYSGIMGWGGELESRLGRGAYGFGAAYQALEEDQPLSGELVGAFFEAPAINHLSKVGKNIYKGKYEKAFEQATPFADLHALDDFYEE